MTRRSPRRRRRNGRFAPTRPGTVPGKRSVSVSRSTFERVKERAGDGGDAMAWVVDDAVTPVFTMSAAEQAALVERIRGERVVTVQVAARRVQRPRPAPPPERPIPFWLLPTGPVRRG